MKSVDVKTTAPYTCAECGMPVIVLSGGHKIRACAHHTAAVHANMTATVSAHGGVAVQHLKMTSGDSP